MMLEIIGGVVSFELAKLLSEVVDEKSYWYWVDEKDLGNPFLENYQDCMDTESDCYPAYTVDELGKLILSKFSVELPSPYFMEGGYKWEYVHGNDGESISDFFEETEADARARLLYGLCNGNIILDGVDKTTDEEPKKKKKRGRPRKIDVDQNVEEVPKKRKRGRPRKIDVDQNVEEVPKKRKRGRPCKIDVENNNQEPIKKRKRGRPRKNDTIAEVKTYENGRKEKAI